MNAVPASQRPRPRTTVILAIVILVPALIGFATKFREFLLLVGDQEGGFTVMPVLNYLLVSFGFLLLFGWAMLHGMFSDIEKPKFTMMENEKHLDDEEAQTREEECWR
jgi:hypothetical protein